MGMLVKYLDPHWCGGTTLGNVLSLKSRLPLLAATMLHIRPAYQIEIGQLRQRCLVVRVKLGYNKRSSERKWPKRAKGTKGSQQNLEDHCWTRCVRISEAMRTHPIRGRHAQKAVSAQMRTHSELLCVRISGS
ncbi:hypothetical protein PIB30_020113 [Stylosanthes scabra]|uniref:Uncharacterized protein n=1 Tax=Stylosanthes scabra TaxID=79078 RepID=A0ABU6X958_9FABA|nr:hypothetical protein [Stylosanthes scabra]